MRNMLLSTLVGATLATTATVATAETSTNTFALYIAGIRAGTIQTTGKTTGSTYAVAGKLEPTSFLRRLRDVGYTGSANGALRKGAFQPSKYNGNTKTGSRNSTVAMRFSGGKPIVDRYSPEREKRPYDINPAAQRGTIDLLTAAHSVFDAQPSASLCNRTIPMFDGRRRSKLTLSKPSLKGDTATCAGTYTRVAGFSPEDMKERVNFPFKLVYERLDDTTFRLQSFSSKTTFGSAKAVRK